MSKPTDQQLANHIADFIQQLEVAASEAKAAGLIVHFTADETGQTITSRVSRDYTFDVTKGKHDG